MEKIEKLKIARTEICPEILSGLERLDKEVGEVCLVGGNTRDFFLSGKLGQDFDVEVRPREALSEKQWIDLVLAQFPGKKYKLLPMQVIRITLTNGEIELSLPRKDFYIQGMKSYGHSDFTVEFSNAFTYEQSFARRDFTCNAIGLIYGSSDNKSESVEFSIVDPYNGRKDLLVRKLRPVTTDFAKDPVRWLRLLRFRERLQFTFQESDFPMSEGNLEGLTSYYLLKECLGNNLFACISQLTKWIANYSWSTPPWLSTYYFLGKFDLDPNFYRLGSQTELLGMLLCRYYSDIQSSDYEKLATALQTKKLLINSLMAALEQLKKQGPSGLEISGRQKEQLRILRPTFENIVLKAKNPPLKETLTVAECLLALLK